MKATQRAKILMDDEGRIETKWKRYFIKEAA